MYLDMVNTRAIFSPAAAAIVPMQICIWGFGSVFSFHLFLVLPLRDQSLHRRGEGTSTGAGSARETATSYGVTLAARSSVSDRLARSICLGPVTAAGTRDQHDVEPTAPPAPFYPLSDTTARFRQEVRRSPVPQLRRARWAHSLSGRRPRAGVAKTQSRAAGSRHRRRPDLSALGNAGGAEDLALWNPSRGEDSFY